MASRHIVSFDVGGTLIYGDKAGFCSQVCRLLGKSIEDIRPSLVKHFLTKETPLVVAVEEFCLETGLADSATVLSSYHRPSPILYDDVIPTLKLLKAFGCEIITSSNCTPWESGGIAELGLSEYLANEFYSFQLGFAKPSFHAFEAVADKLRAEPGDFVHVGDSWTAAWLCGALGVSRGGFYAWLT